MAGQAWVWASSSASAAWAWCATPSARCWDKRPTPSSSRKSATGSCRTPRSWAHTTSWCTTTAPAVSLPAHTWKCPARAMPLSTTRSWTPSNTTSNARWASTSRCTATPSPPPATTCAAGSSMASCRSIPRSPSTTCTNTMALCHLTWCVPTAFASPTTSCWSA